MVSIIDDSSCTFDTITSICVHINNIIVQLNFVKMPDAVVEECIRLHSFNHNNRVLARNYGFTYHFCV